MLHQDFGVLRLKGDLGCAPRARPKTVAQIKPFWRARVRGAQLRILSPQGPLSKEILLIKHVSLRQLQQRFESSQVSVAGPSLAA
jgi:hypothetical protein